MRLYHYLESKWALDDIRRRRLKVSKIDDMNDPYEWKCVRSNNWATRTVLEMTEKQTVEKYGALCFSRSWNNILMWSHYGDRHRGVCLGFDVSDEHCIEVTYLDSLMMVRGLENTSSEEKMGLINLLFAAKYEGWRYEEEVRVNSTREERDEETGQCFVDFSEHLKLREVIAGPRFPMSKGPIEDALRGYPEPVEIVKARRSLEGFAIIVDERGFDMAMNLYCGDVTGFRVNEEKVRTVTLVSKVGTDWVDVETRRCPLSPMVDFPPRLLPTSPHGRWELAWLSLLEEHRDKAGDLLAQATVGFSRRIM